MILAIQEFMHQVRPDKTGSACDKTVHLRSNLGSPWRGMITGARTLLSARELVVLSADKSVRSPITLPHKQSCPAGLGIYISEFDLDLAAPEQPGIGVKLSHCSGKANIYINGWLAGRYWDAVGPQKIFYLPPDLLNTRGKNELTIAVWPWGREMALGEVEIVEYP